MGLDMYLRGDKFISRFDNSQRDKDGIALEIKRPVIDGFEVASYNLDLGYWRKFAPLHQYIVKVFADDVDECQEIHLDSSDCHRIADALRNNGLPDNEDCGGFLFGSPEFWDDYMVEAEDHARVFDKAAAWIESNSWNSVTYQASW